MPNEPTFIKLLNEHTEAIADYRRFAGLLNDYFPQEPKMRRVLLNLHNLGIHNGIDSVSSITDRFANKYIKNLVNNYGVSNENAWWAVDTWCVCYGKEVLGKPCNISEFVANSDDVFDEDVDNQRLRDRYPLFPNRVRKNLDKRFNNEKRAPKKENTFNRNNGEGKPTDLNEKYNANPVMETPRNKPVNSTPSIKVDKNDANKLQIKVTIKRAPVNPITHILHFDPAAPSFYDNLYWLRSLLNYYGVIGKTGEEFINVTTSPYPSSTTGGYLSLAYLFDGIFGDGMAREVFKYAGKDTLVKIINEVEKGIKLYNGQTKQTAKKSTVNRPVNYVPTTQNKQVNSYVQSYKSAGRGIGCLPSTTAGLIVFLIVLFIIGQLFNACLNSW